MATEPRPDLTPDELDGFRRQLIELRDRLLTRISTLEREAAARQSAGAGNSWGAIGGEADEAWDNILTLGALTNNRLLLHEVSQACERLSNNQFGLCVKDHAAIPKSLLNDTPWAKYCTTCAGHHQIS